jgi:hypothetical protein
MATAPRGTDPRGLRTVRHPSPMADDTHPASTEDQSGARRLALGAGLGLAAAILTIVLPLSILYIAAYSPGGFFAIGSDLFSDLAILVLAGAILFLISLFVFRRGFATLRKVDPRFWAASVLCLIGSIGFLLIVVLAAVVLDSTSSLSSCLHGAPSHALSCLRSNQPLGAYSGLLGFVLTWLGGLGIVLGLSLAGHRFVRGSLSGGAVLYLLLLLVLVVPFVALITPVPGVQYVILIAPVLAVLAPALVLSGAGRPPETIRGA